VARKVKLGSMQDQYSLSSNMRYLQCCHLAKVLYLDLLSNHRDKGNKCNNIMNLTISSYMNLLYIMLVEEEN
jgi:hypothetical protein